ncbi:LuxR C-terminal-related transcriptional regulator [Enterococcus sp. AZ163]|uniref:LuxR C-terminal-related transcriptional regulator n=1 Tax=Enterococcus sp. AZ163 TaxID=2774638 RepID=UPI003D2D1D7B
MGILVSSRMIPPKLKSNRIPRKQLVKKIQTGFNKKVTVLEAGAGHGKTLALRQSVEALPNQKWCWLNLAEDSNQLTLFWSYVLESLSDFLGNEKEVAFDNFQRSLQEGNLTSFGVFLLEILPKQDIYLVLDDFHHIIDTKLVASIDSFVAAMPDYLHLLLVTRYKPAIYLGQLLIEDELQYIQEADFLITPTEAKSVMLEVGYGNLSTEIQDQLISKAQGWLGGLQLLLLSGDFSPTVGADTSEKKIVFDYLAKEILDKLPKIEQNYLIHTSYYPFVFPELSCKLFPEINYEEMLEKLQKQHLMINRLENKEASYVYHPLLRDVLIEAFIKQEAAEIVIQKKQAAEVFLQQSYFDEGLSLLFEVEDYQQIMTLLLERPQNLRTSFYIQQVPDDAAVANIDFAFQKIFYYYTILNYEKLEQLICALEAAFPALQEAHVFNGLLALLGVEFIEVEDIRLSPVFLHSLPLNDVSKAFLFLQNALFFYYKNEFQEAILFVEESLSLNRKGKNPFINYFCETFLAQIYEEIGDFQQGLVLLERTYAKIEHMSADARVMRNYHLSFNLTIAGIYLKKMELTSAEKALQEIAQQQHPHIRASYLYNYAELHYLKGEEEEALAAVQQLELTDYYQNLRIKAGLFRYMLKSHQLSIGKQEQYLEDYAQMNQLSISNRLFYGMLLLARNERAKALKMVDQVLEISRRERIYFRIIGADLLKIDILLQMENCEERIFQDLYHEAIHYGKENKILCEFFLYKKELMILFNRLGNRICENFEPDELLFHEKINRLICPEEKTFLSKRELEVLRELTKGLTNKEISAQLFISMATTKTHILNIYRKLGVSSRVMAVEKARHLKLLE